MKAEEFLAFASKLALLYPQPAAVRTAISRAYYAAFHGAAQFLREQSIFVDARHGSVWIDFSAAPQFEARAIGRQLSELHALRVVADYRLERVDIEEVHQAITCVETASQILSYVETLRRLCEDSELQTQFTQAILNRRKLTGRR
jgi:uncharacterized protein (UPF0332 family)